MQNDDSRIIKFTLKEKNMEKISVQIRDPIELSEARGFPNEYGP
jgi:hypothetical protein